MVRKRKQHGWSFAADRQLIELAASSTPLDDMAAIMKRAVKALERRAKRLGLVVRPASLESGVKTRSQKIKKTASSAKQRP